MSVYRFCEKEKKKSPPRKSNYGIISICIGEKGNYFKRFFFFRYHHLPLSRKKERNSGTYSHAFKSFYFFLNYILLFLIIKFNIIAYKVLFFFRKCGNHLMWLIRLFVHAVWLWQLAEAGLFLGRHLYRVYVHINETLQLSYFNLNTSLPLQLIMAVDNCHSESCI